jgi:hypothetical protein
MLVEHEELNFSRQIKSADAYQNQLMYGHKAAAENLGAQSTKNVESSEK